MNIPRGRDAAITIGALAESYQLPRRAVEQAIENLRREGVPVCSGSEGVWLCSSPQEAAEMADRLRRRYISQAITARAMRRSARAWANRDVEELTLWDEVA